MWYDKRYHTLDYELKKVFGEKAVKLSIDGGFTCPNRDGTIGKNGCIFCSEKGSGDFTSGRDISIEKQVEIQKNIMSKKWKSNSYIVYFQNFTNTYDSVENLRRKYYEAMNCFDVKGIAIATRPDCINRDIVELLSEISSKTYLWVELGLQSIHESTATIIRRGYVLNQFDKSMELLNKYSIRTVVHLIMGLPHETKEDMIESVKYISKFKPWGVKFHLLHVLRDTDLELYFNDIGFEILSQEEYISIICDCLEILPSDITVHRLTGDGKKSELIAPLWSLNKLKVLTDIDKELKNRNSFQGCKLLL